MDCPRPPRYTAKVIRRILIQTGENEPGPRSIDRYWHTMWMQRGASLRSFTPQARRVVMAAKRLAAKGA